MLRRFHALLLASSWLASLGCGDSGETGGGGSGGQATGGAPTGGGGSDGGGGEGGTAADPSIICGELDLPIVALSEGPYGSQRGDVAEPFELPLTDGSTWRFEDRFAGCELYLFLPDTLVVSDLDDRPLWEGDLPALFERSPRNVHYFFVSRRTGDEAADNISGMADRIEDFASELSEADAAHLLSHYHVVAEPAAELEGWVPDVLGGLGAAGFAIDRRQQIKGVGFFADVNRFSSALQQAELWPWRSNISYAAHDASYLNAQEAQRARLEAEDVTEIVMWDGEILEEFAEVDVTLPSAEEMAGFDTLEIEVESLCPDATKIEFNNCGAWDYLATLAVRGADDVNVEIARFITAYHRETHWVVDASPMLALLREGGEKHFRWDFAPNWNKQPTATRMKLRLSNRGEANAPAEVTKLWSGGPFNAAYNTPEVHAPIDVEIPADAERVQLFVLVTGHGAGQSNCAEFCNHEHEITVAGTTLSRDFPQVGSDDACIAELERGMVPNQGGTWWFGRGGWCPGQHVQPWVEDVTDLVTPGQTATLSYRGLFNGADPPDNSGDIVLSSYLVVYR